jgi:hypothetical protein
MGFFGVVSTGTTGSTTTGVFGGLVLLSILFGSLNYNVEGFQSRPLPLQQLNHLFNTNVATPITSTTALTYLPLTTSIRQQQRRRQNGIVVQGKTMTLWNPNHRFTTHVMADMTATSSAAEGGSKPGVWQKVRRNV